MTDETSIADPILTEGYAKPSESNDTLSQRGAMALARRLQQFWHEQGHTEVRFWAEPIDERFEKIGSYEVYRVVSNLVNGAPPRCRCHG